MKQRIKNVMILDLTELTPETADTIIKIDTCMVALFSEKSAQLMGRLSFGNLMTSAVVPEGVKAQVSNGKLHLTAGNIQAGAPRYLVCNGYIIIDPDVAPDALSTLYAGGVINGKVVCTRPQADALQRVGFTVNGSWRVYPDGARLVEGSLTVDAAFAAQAEEGALYYATGRVIALHDGLAALAAKGIRLMGSTLITREGMRAAAQAVWAGEAGAMRFVPDDLTYIAGDTTIDRIALRRHGSKLYIDGDCAFAEGLTAEQLQAGLERMQVSGNLVVPEALLDDVLSVCDSFDDVYDYPGRLLRVSGKMTLSAATLEGLPAPVTLFVEGMGELTPDVTPELVREKLLAVYVFGELHVPETVHGLMLSLARRVEGEIRPVEEDAKSTEEKPDGDVRITGNAMELKLV